VLLCVELPDAHGDAVTDAEPGGALVVGQTANW
jgi:hypothetical protein